MRKSRIFLAAFACIEASALYNAALVRASASPLYVTLSNSVVEYNTSGVSVATTPASPPLATAYDTAFDSAGNVYVANYANTIITEYSSTLTNGATFGNSALASNPRGIAFDSQGNLWIAEANGDIGEITPNGTVNNYTTTMPQVPQQIGIDSSGNLFVADLTAGVYEFAGSGGVPNITGNDPTAAVYNSSLITASTQSVGAAGIALDSSGNLYITSEKNGGDSANNLLLKLTPDFASPNSAAITTISSTLTISSQGNGSLGFDSAGNLYVGEYTGISGDDYIDEVNLSNGNLTQFLNTGLASATTQRFFAFDNVPEPATIGLLGAVGAASLLRRRRRGVAVA